MPWPLLCLAFHVLQQLCDEGAIGEPKDTHRRGDTPRTRNQRRRIRLFSPHLK